MGEASGTATASASATATVDAGAARGVAPRRLLAREERQASILRAAASAFATAGFATTSMEDVAAAAGVTKLIVYRHFGSKEDLYRAVLSGVAQRLHDEFVLGMSLDPPARYGFTTRSMLTVARENPDGFRLLMVHAGREPQFAELDQQFKAQGLAIADAMIGDTIPDPAIKAWASRVFVDYLVQGVLAWLDVGPRERDEELVALATQGLVGMYLSIVDRAQLPDALRHALDRVRDEQAKLAMENDGMP